MAFGQPSGSPASARQLEELLQLLHDAGHADFRDARGPMGFTQRQAAGRFTHDEARELIARLIEAEPADRGVVDPRRRTRPAPVQQSLRAFSDDLLADELRRRGWIVDPPAATP